MKQGDIHLTLDRVEAMELLICSRHRIEYSRVDRVWLRRVAIKELCELAEKGK